MKLLILKRDLQRVFSLIWKADKRIALINLVLQFVQALMPVVSLYITKSLIDALIKGGGNIHHVLYLILLFGLAQFIQALAAQYGAYIGTIHQEKLTDHLSAEVLNKAIEVDHAYYENPAYHDTLHLAQLQSLYKAPVLLANFNALVLNSLSLVFLAGIFFTLNALFALLFVSLSLPLALIKWYSGFALLRLERKLAPMEREAGYLHHTLTNVTFAKEVRVFGFGRSFIEKFNYIRQHIHDERKKLNIRYTIYSLIAESVEIVVMVCIFWLLAKNAWERTITIGVFVIYLQGFQRLQSNSKNFLQALVQLFQQRLFLQDLFAFFDIPKNTNASGTDPFPVIKTGLSVSNLSFTYPGTEREVLHDVSIHCAPGKIIAIVGENGSGKSTLIKLMARLYDAKPNTIKIEGVAIDDIAIDEFRKHSVFLFQDFERYFLTIEENIALGNEIDPAAVLNAAKLSGAHDFIAKLSQGYQTRMGRLFEGSEQISGGQWQKLALARVFYKETQLIVLDEPTSALDAIAELSLFKNIKAGLGQKMGVFITHRLYNLKIADHIYVMQDGRIAEEGGFDALIKKDGIFTALYNAQRL